MKRIVCVMLLLASVAILTSGCMKAAEGSKFNYASGNLSAVLAADVQKSYDAALKACGQLELPVTEKTKDALGAQIVTKTAADKKVTISLKRVTDATTDLVISIGTVGDKETSSNIYTKILENLKK